MQAEYYPKIQNAISKAISFLDRVTAAQKSSESTTPRPALWHASEETEYAAAVLSLTQGFVDLDPELKNPDLKEAETERGLSLARTLLVDSLGLLERNPALCYEKLRYAVQVIRRIQAKESK